MPLNDATDWIAQVVVSALFRFSNTADYVELVKASRNRKPANVANMKAQFEAIKRHHPSSPRPLATYTGTYHNNLRNFYTVIRQHSRKLDCLVLVFQGRDTQVYGLRHLRSDSFEWALNLDTQARRARFTNWDSEYFEVDFLFSEDGKVSSLQRGQGRRVISRRQFMNQLPDDRTGSSSSEYQSDDESRRIVWNGPKAGQVLLA